VRAAELCLWLRSDCWIPSDVATALSHVDSLDATGAEDSRWCRLTITRS